MANHRNVVGAKKAHAAWVNPISSSQAPAFNIVREDRRGRTSLEIRTTAHSRTEYEIIIGDLKVVNMGQNKAKAEEWVRWIEEIVQQ